MVRAHPQYDPQGYAPPQDGEWQDLRSELVALLDQVETQVARTQRPDPGYQGLTERMRDLRHQVTEVEPETRHREALRSVQKAVAKFSDRDDELPPLPSNPRDTLESAIQQIRSRHFAPPPLTPPPLREPPRVMDSPRFDELAEAVGGISGRLERLESELRSQARGQTANVKDIADQVGQLSQVVELLAGAVGETGQVKRLEGQIAGLAKLMAREPQVDMPALTRRLDDVSQTVAKLAELQKAYADRSDTSGLTQRLDDVTATVGRLADLQVKLVDRADTSGLTRKLDDVTATVGKLADLQMQFANRVENPQNGLKDAMQAIEEGVRNIYDRVDSIERQMAMPQAELEKVTDELQRFAAAMKAPQQPQGLIELIDALNVRISDIEMRGPAATILKADVDAMRSAVVEAMEPRFAALEMQLETISGRVASPAALNIGQLEAQVRQLVARMDQTGEQLTGLARLYSQPAAREPAPDFGTLADMVAERTTAAVNAGKQPAGIGEPEYAEIEKRLSRVVQTVAAGRPAEGNSALEATIREVNERLARLEQSVSRPAPLAAAAPASTPAPIAFAPLLDEIEREEAQTAATRPAEPEVAAAIGAVPPPRDDFMPANPAEDAPLYDKPFSDPTPLQRALEAKNGPRRRHPGMIESKAERQQAPVLGIGLAPAAEPGFDHGEPAPEPFGSAATGRPLPPQSSLDADPASRVAHTPEPAPSASRNTFIAAARRAAMRQAPNPAPAAIASIPGGSLIARAFARFQAGRAAGPGIEAAGAPAIPVPPPAAEAKPHSEKPGQERRVLPLSPEPATVALGAEETSPRPDGAVPEKQSFLVRHRQPILLAASLVAIICLTVNFINRRMEEAAPATAAAPPVTVGDAALSPTPLAQQLVLPGQPAEAGARVIPMVDSLRTASADPSAARGFALPADSQPMPPAVAAATEIAAGDAVAAEVANLSGAIAPLAAADPLESPVKVELPPDTVGPEPLRRAAADGDARAQFEIAAIYTEGRAIPEDMEIAAVWYERAAGQGFAPAQYRLGNLYESGKGVGKDLAQARIWYEQAAEAGNRMAMHNLAALYAGGGLGTQQFDSAARWFEEAANRGMKDSQFNLGMLYARGLGVKQDLGASFKWFALAASRGDADAARARDEMAASLDAPTVQRLEDEVAAWKPAQIDLAANFAPIGTWMKDFDPGAPIGKLDVVKGVQQALDRLGFDVGAPDGLAGPKTVDAIRAFERGTGMNETGAINPRLLAVLGSQPV